MNEDEIWREEEDADKDGEWEEEEDGEAKEREDIPAKAVMIAIRFIINGLDYHLFSFYSKTIII